MDLVGSTQMSNTLTPGSDASLQIYRPEDGGTGEVYTMATGRSIEKAGPLLSMRSGCGGLSTMANRVASKRSTKETIPLRQPWFGRMVVDVTCQRPRRMKSAMRSPMSTEERWVFARTPEGMIEASTTRSPSMP